MQPAGTPTSAPDPSAMISQIAKQSFIPNSVIPDAIEPWMPLIQSVLFAIVLFVVGWLLSRWVARLMRAGLQRAHIDAALARFLSGLVRYGILAATIITALGAVGIETTSLVAVFASAGLAIGLALQGSLANFAAGAMILFFRPIRLDDVVTVAGQTGRVQEIGVFATVLINADNHRVTIPNSAITSGNIINYTILGTRRAEIAVGVAYGSPLEAVQTTVLKACAAVDTVLADPAPSLFFASMDASSLTFTLYYWTDAAEWWGTQDRVRRAVYEALVAAGIEIPFDQLVVHRAEPDAA